MPWRILSIFVSIPFREDLHSDLGRYSRKQKALRVSIPFREDLHSDPTKFMHSPRVKKRCFHPFQGRPSFGRKQDESNKANWHKQFPSLSGKTFIRTWRIDFKLKTRSKRVSIPFREDLHSDYRLYSATYKARYVSFHPFQGRPSFGRYVYRRPPRPGVPGWFPSLSGKTFIRTYYKRSSSKRKFSLVSIPFREDLHSDLKKLPHNLRYQNRWFPSLSGKTFIRTVW